MFARAIVLDSTYGRAFAGVADCCSFLYMYYESSDENLNEADTASRKAVELDAKLFEAHYFYARALYSQGKLEEAAQKSEDAYRVNPGDYQSPIFQAQTFLSLGRRAHASAGFSSDWVSSKKPNSE
jgi:tetratricopeptide (TPR) repeat protein